MINKNLLVILLIISSCFPALAQKDKQNCADSKVRIKMLKTKDGTTIMGDEISKNDSIISINTNSLGIINIPVSQVLSNNDVVCSRIINGDYWFENPGSNFYMISPSAFSSEKGSFYYRNTFIILNTFGYGITDHLTINAGFDFITLFEKFEDQPRNPDFFIMPQYNFSVSENIKFGTSLLYIKDYENYFDGSILAPMLNFSYGTSDRNIGFCTGYNFLDDNPEHKKPFIIFNGLYRLTNRFALEAEYLNVYDFYLINYGFKFIARNMAIDFGFMNNSDIFEEFTIGIPFVSFTLRK